jgi:hypothetical protein
MPAEDRDGTHIYDRRGNYIGPVARRTPEAEEAGAAREAAEERLADRERAQRSGWKLPILGRHRKRR